VLYRLITVINTFKVSSVKVVKDEIYVTLTEDYTCIVARVKNGFFEPVIMLPQRKLCLFVQGLQEALLISVDNTLYVVRESEGIAVLKTLAGNWFWHGIEACDTVFIQEYGEPPTGIYVSEDLKSFRRMVTNRDIDPSSRHFHYITFDRDRKILITTLGDGNIVRVAFSDDCGSSWRPLYKGPWQFVPVFIEGNKWIFGFDSGIARGGVAIYYPERDIWRFIFLKADGYAHAQFASITRFGDYYVGSLGFPTAVVISKDLLYWYSLHIDPTSTKYNHFVNATAWKDKVVATTGKELLIFNSRAVEEAFRRKPFLTPYKAYLDRVKGALYVLKRFLWMLRL
jgi:hypothetical protein